MNTNSVHPTSDVDPSRTESAPVGALTENFRIGDFLVLPELNRIQTVERSHQVEPRIFQVLVCLAENANRVVTRESLLETVWSDTIVNEESLTRAISELRSVFDDDPRRPRFIETIRKGGYRLIAEVQPAEGAVGPPSGQQPAITVERRSGFRRFVHGGRVTWSLLAVFILIASGALWLGSNHSSRAATVEIVEAIPFTSYPGEEVRPAISPDGSRVAFAWAGPTQDNLDIYVKQRNTETPLRLTDTPARETAPAWSEDGLEIAFVRATQVGSGIFTKPAIGGGERLLHEGASLIESLDWSPDGKWIVYSERDEPTSPCRLRVLALDSYEQRNLTSPPNQFTGDIRPRFSPDGSQVAFVRGNRIGLNDIYVVGFEGGEPRRLTTDGSGIRGLAWDSSGDGVYFSSIAKGPYSLWRVEVDDLSLHRTPVNVEWIFNPSVASHTGAVVIEAHRFELDIWQIMLDDPAAPRHTDVPLIWSTRLDTQARYSPDGRAIAFISSRTGKLEIWVCAADGSNAEQLTDLGGSLVGNPRWSPDGRLIAFHMPSDDYSAVFVVDVAGRTVRKLSQGGHNDRVTSWSRDGRWIYFGSDATGSWQLWKMGRDGAEPVQVTSDGGITGQESTDGEVLFFVAPDSSGIWQMPVSGGEARLVLETVNQGGARDWDNWIVTNGGIYFTRREVGGHAIAYHDLADGSTRAVTRVPSRPCRRSLAVSPDGKAILYCRLDNLESDLMIVDGLL